MQKECRGRGLMTKPEKDVKKIRYGLTNYKS